MHPPRNRVAGRLVAGNCEQDEERTELGRCEPLPVDLGVHQDRRDVVGRRREPALTELLRVVEHSRRPHDEAVEVHREVGVAGAEDEVRPIEDLLLVLLRHAEHVADDLQRQGSGERLDEVDRLTRGPLLFRGGDQPLGAHAHRLLDRRDRLRGEALLDEEPELRVAWVVHHDHRPEELERLGWLFAEGDPRSGGEQFGLAVDLLDVVVRHRRPETRAADSALDHRDLLVEAHAVAVLRLVPHGSERLVALVERLHPEVVRSEVGVGDGAVRRHAVMVAAVV